MTPQKSQKYTIATCPFLMEAGGIFAPEPPQHGFYFDCLDRSIRVSLGGAAISPVSTEWVGGRAPFRYFSTALSRQAGKGECWGGCVPSRAGILAAARQGNATRSALGGTLPLNEKDLIDLVRFSLQTRMMFLLDEEVAVYGELLAKGSRDAEVVVFFPSKGAASVDEMLSNGDFKFSVDSESRGGAHGRKESRVVDWEGVRFYLDKSNGTLCKRGGGIVATGLGLGRSGGSFCHIDWRMVPKLNAKLDINKELAEIGQILGGRRGRIALSGDLGNDEVKLALLEILAYHCHKLGPNNGDILRAKGVLVSGDGGAWISSSGSKLSRRSPEEWGKCRQSELAKLLLTCRSAGISNRAKGFSKLEEEVAGRKSKYNPRAKNPDKERGLGQQAREDWD